MDSDDSRLEDYIWSRDYIDAISDLDIISTPQQLVDGMDRLKPRLYSIASSPEYVSQGLSILLCGIPSGTPIMTGIEPDWPPVFSQIAAK